MQRTTLLSIAATLLATGCVAPISRHEPGGFEKTATGQIAKEKTSVFVDCLMDGFDAAHFIMTNIHIRQQRRADSVRVEALTNSALLASASVFDDGRAELIQLTNGSGMTIGERTAFDECLKTHAPPK